ncbi:GrpB family protein [Luteimicrobium xylanilyticum]
MAAELDLTVVTRPDDAARSRPTGLIGGIEKREIRIVPADPAWPGRFEAERDRIRTALGARAMRIDHVGSTSVPGLAAKPIVDIDLSVADVEDEDDYLPALLDAGYVLRVREPGHRLVRTPELDVQVHVCPTGSDWERRHLLFRDRLRDDDADRRLYQDLKLRLAQQDWPDMNAYSDAKGPLIAEILVRAEEWAAATGWRP